MKTWHEIVTEIQQKPEFSYLVKNAYFSIDLNQNYELFSSSDECKEIISLLKLNGACHGKSIVDIGCGNGITSIAFAQIGLDVTCIEPDKSDLVGTGAIKKLAKDKNLYQRIKCLNEFAEKIPFEDNSFDFAFARQSLHHANNLDNYCKEVFRVLKPGGIFLTVRDHVIFNNKDKEWFLETHPLHKFYGGENAFRKEEYVNAFENAGFQVEKILGHYESPINYFPMKKYQYQISKILKPIASFINSTFVNKVLVKLFNYSDLDEEKVPGRLYTFLARKQ